MCQATVTKHAHAADKATPSSNSDLWILDGGTGREIERRGGPFRQPEWSALALYENPQLVRDIHESFLDAGATAITTNTYAIVPFHLGRERYDRDAKWLLELATDLAVQAKGDRATVQVMGSIPPISGSYQPGLFDEAIAGPIIHDFLNAFRGKVDAIILETMGSAQEAKFALQEIQKSGVNLPVYLSFYVQANNEGKARLLTNDTLSEAVEYLQQCELLSVDRVPMVLVNCCDIYLVDDALAELSSILGQKRFRIGAYPNAFSAPPAAAANVKAREVNKNISPHLLQTAARKWIHEYGATAVGGCCGIGPDHIQAVAEIKNDGPPALEVEQPTITKEPGISGPRVLSCSVQGCGCGVQIGFGQKPPLLCAEVSASASPESNVAAL